VLLDHNFVLLKYTTSLSSEVFKEIRQQLFGFRQQDLTSIMASQSTTLPHRPAAKFVNAENLHSFVTDLDNLTRSQPSKIIFIDLEGIKLSRHGSISLLTLLIHDTSIQSPDPDQLYLIDIHTLGSSAFTEASATPAYLDVPACTKPVPSPTLQQILESPAYLKILFDVRNDSDALFAHFGIRLQGTLDLQLMENLSRRSQNKRLVHGLGRCIKSDSLLSIPEKKTWEVTKEAGRKLFAPEKGGRYEVFNERPLKQEMVDYCTQDVWCMPGLYRVYKARLEVQGALDWVERIRRETAKRLVESMGAGYQPHGRDKALAPDWDAVIM
jgi:exonuclease 3'-5' domain-containing protein 1